MPVDTHEDAETPSNLGFDGPRPADASIRSPSSNRDSSADEDGSLALDSQTRASGDDGTAAPPISKVCGDAIRDPVTEECDDGFGAAGTTCTADCRVRDVAIVAEDDAGLPDGGAQHRALGSAPHVAAATDSSFAVVHVEPTASGSTLLLQSFTSSGTRQGAPLDVAYDYAPLATANPAVAALPQGALAVAWTDASDGSPEIRIRSITGTTRAQAALAHASTSGAHSDPDLLWVGNRLIAAWTHLVSVEYRAFDADLTPLGPEGALVPSSTAIQSSVSLAAFADAWAAAFRSGGQGLETVVVSSGDTTWSTPPDQPGPVEDRPAIVELDDMHLLLVFSAGTDPADSGAATVGRLRGAVLDISSPGMVQPFPIMPQLAPYSTDLTLSQHRPSAMRVGNEQYIAWESSSPGAAGEQVFVARVALDASAPNGLRQDEELRLPYPDGGGWQSNVHLASSPLFPAGALISAWETATDETSRATSDVMLDFRPSPFVFLGAAGMD